jgi:hypothetical protein
MGKDGRYETRITSTVHPVFLLLVGRCIVLTGDDFINGKTDLDKELCKNSLLTKFCTYIIYRVSVNSRVFLCWNAHFIARFRCFHI